MTKQGKQIIKDINKMKQAKKDAKRQVVKGYMIKVGKVLAIVALVAIAVLVTVRTQELATAYRVEGVTQYLDEHCQLIDTKDTTYYKCNLRSK